MLLPGLCLMKIVVRALIFPQLLRHAAACSLSNEDCGESISHSIEACYCLYHGHRRQNHGGYGGYGPPKQLELVEHIPRALYEFVYCSIILYNKTFCNKDAYTVIIVYSKFTDEIHH